MPNAAVEAHSFILNAGKLPTEKGEALYIRGEVRFQQEPGGDSLSPKPVLLISHGFKGFKDWGFFPYAASQFAQRGFFVVTFNFSCNGVNENDFDELDKFSFNTYSREQADLSLLLQALLDKQLPEGERADLQRIYLLGHSRGGGNSILFASEHPEVKGVVTWNGNANPDLFDDAFKAAIAEHGVAYVANARTKQQMPIRRGFYEDLAEHRSRYHIPERLSALGIPVLQLQGNRDSDRLQAGFESLRQAAPQHRCVTIAEGTHTFGAVHPFAGTTDQLEVAIQLTADFLKDLLSTAD
ncbi:alpha/beta hydrolase family protein [Paenibacillus radicis (ex Xue et al. 2023)]|uniref:Alpha/beta hydrolase n=1 Tax=Paenibacillus radicis (ex Xue et al. 2023) TaxID=2972489 RepID=A0ABT1YM94_9BACL|nr:alpha/beta hydrolase [Paenibacillus radicis (ex Xue et al. 2023)]MCR8634297.1 alpha/beta hydrolase [Paenibacillus radicis (ex Xue et al. 2023)]